MKKILVIVMLIFAFGYSDDETEPSENTIVGKWSKDESKEREINQSLLVVEFTNDGKFTLSVDVIFEPKILDEGSYSIDGNEIEIVSGQCEIIKGKYRFEFKNNGVEFILKEDECEAREYLVGFYEKYTETILK